MSEDNDRLSNEFAEPPDAFLDKTLKQESHLSPEAETPETVCRNCIFAVYEENTQTSCELGRIQKFKDKGVVVDDCYDDQGNEFFVIRDRYCVFWRNEDWANVHKDPVFAVRRESKIKFKCIIYISESNDMEDVEETLISVLEQDLQPKHVTFINNNSSIQPIGLKRLCNRFNISFSIEHINDKSLTRGLCVNIAANKVNANFFGYISVFDAGHIPIKDFYSKINTAIVDDLEQILAIEGDEGNGDVYQTKAYKMTGGNLDTEEEREELFIDKIKRISESQGCKHLVRNLEQVLQA
tara:strand:+ start:301 stop:1188 length:888 start_codon:yes stop_codon:yes gene_type:complete